MQIEEAFNDSNSLFSASIIAPLAKRQTTSKIYSKNNFSLQEKIEDIGFQIVDQLSIITPLEVNPKDLCEGISTYKYQRKSPSIMEADFYKKFHAARYFLPFLALKLFLPIDDDYH